jgi:hypothetical protein
MNEIIFEIQEAPEGGYLAQALDYSIFTQAENLETLRPQIKDAVNCHFDEAEKLKVIRLHFVREEVMVA